MRSNRPHGLGEARPDRTVGELGLRRLPARVEHLDVSVLLGRQCLQRRIERSKRIVAVKGGANHDVKERCAPAGGGIAVGDERRLVCGLDRLGF